MKSLRPLLVAIPIAVVGYAAVGSAAPSGSTDLKLTKTAGAASVAVGSTLTYTIEVANLGPETATGVTVTDPLPKGADHVSASSTLGQCALQGRRVTCSIGTLETGPASKVSTATVTLAVIPRQSGTISNTASVDGDQKDPVAANDRATVTTPVIGKVAPADCRGVTATIVGTTGNDSIVGSGGRDVIAGLGGSDSIASLAGRDLVCAGAGNDHVAAGSDADRVFGGPGGDRLLGRGGNDRLRGGRGFDVCRGGSGVNSIRGCER
jgi:uncharacterized repeat protein (TIGR01451 family)